jgi:hypothetical protein
LASRSQKISHAKAANEKVVAIPKESKVSVDVAGHTKKNARGESDKREKNKQLTITQPSSFAR